MDDLQGFIVELQICGTEQVQTDECCCLTAILSLHGLKPTEGDALVLSQHVVCRGHYSSFVGHHTDHLHNAAQLFVKLENT